MRIDQVDNKELAEKDGQYVIRPQNKEEVKRNEETIDDIPQYRIKIEASPDFVQRLTEQFTEEFDALKEEREVLGLPGKWKSLDNQYDGTLARNQRLNFNLHLHQSKIKADAVARALNEAFLDSQPMIDVSPRPEQWRDDDKSGVDVCELQQQFLSYEIEENIKPGQDLELIGLCAVKKFVGIGKLEWAYEKEKRKREEVYEGKNTPMLDNDKNPIVVNGAPQMENIALKEFTNNYPNWEERGYQSYYNKIKAEKTVRIVVTYFDTLVNCAKQKHVSVENFYVKNSTAYYEGLKKAHLVVERDSMTWYDLEKKVKNDEFDGDAIENLKSDINAGGNQNKNATGTSKQTWRTKDYDILEATTYIKLDEEDEEETKIKAWFSETGTEGSKYTFLGAINYPYYGFDIDYIPYYVKLNDDGFYGDAKSVMLDLKDSNIAQDALINLLLDGYYKRAILTPIVPTGSDIAATFIENRWSDGRPIEVDMVGDDVNKAIGFVQYPQMDVNGGINLINISQRNDDAVSGINPGTSGRENPSDPHAPASKTIALLNQSSINIKDYIRNFLPSFNIFVGNILQLYYQMSSEGRKFRVNLASKRVTGAMPFLMITRDQMVAKTNIQSRAAAFAFDKAMEKQEATVAYQAIMANPIILTMPDVQYKAFKIWLKKQSNEWYNFAEDDLPSMEEFQKKMEKSAIKALAQYVQMQNQQAQVTGQPVQYNLNDLKQQISKQQMLDNNPPLAAAQAKQEQKENK